MIIASYVVMFYKKFFFFGRRTFSCIWYIKFVTKKKKNRFKNIFLIASSLTSGGIWLLPAISSTYGGDDVKILS